MKIIHVHQDHDPNVVRQRLTALGLWTTKLEDGEHVSLLASASSSALPSDEAIADIAGVVAVMCSKSPHPIMDAHAPTVDLGDGVIVGGGAPVLMAGPCSVESEEQINVAAKMVVEAGAAVLRGGCFKPRTNPYSFQGIGPQGLVWMHEAAKVYDLKIVTEAMAPQHVDVVAQYSDVFQIGARNMQNFDLLHAVGRAGKPVLLKRGLSATIDEWLQAAEHTMHAGASAVILCERGVRSFDPNTRFLFDIAAVAMIKHQYNLPVIADPSHATGRKDLIPHMGAAALAVGADGLIVETHPNPAVACSDGPQQLDPAELQAAATKWGFVK